MHCGKLPGSPGHHIFPQDFTEWNPFADPLAYNPASGLRFPVWLVMDYLDIPATIAVLNFVQAWRVFFGASGAYFLPDPWTSGTAGP